MVLHQGGLVNQNTLGSNLGDYLNYIRKQEIYKKQYGTDSDFRIIDKVFYDGIPYEQVYAVLDYKRKGELQDSITYVEVTDYNETITSVPGICSTQIVKKDVFILVVDLDTNNLPRDQFEGWIINSISVFQYIKGNPRPEEGGYKSVVVLDGKEIKETGNGVRVDLRTISKNLTFEEYMTWESEYRRKRTNEVIRILQDRDYLQGRKNA